MENRGQRTKDGELQITCLRVATNRSIGYHRRMLGHVCVQLFEKIPNPVNEPELHAYVTNFYVIPEMRDQGLGKRLLNKALSWCRARGTDAVILWPSTASKSFYRQCGFVAPSDIF